MHFLTVPLPEEIEREEKLGNFKRAESLIYRRLQSTLPSPLKERLEYELERIERLIKNYPYSEKKAIKRLFKTIKNFTNREYKTLLEEGLLDYITVKGKRKFESRFIENLIFARPEYRKRVKPNKKREKARQILYKRIKELLDGDKPRTYTVTAEIEIIPQTEKIKGRKVRCWLPYPNVTDQLLDVELIQTSHKDFFISPAGTSQRTIYMEDENRKGLKFSVRFRYKIKEIFFNVKPEDVEVGWDENPTQYLEERPPHIVFSPYLKQLTEEITRNETNPYLKAQRIYKWITHNVRYSYMHPYALYDNIPLFVATNLKGDCGAQALLFITMCRIAGIPAKWQSGWYVNPVFGSPHDWAFFYVKPYGWIPVDLSFGNITTDKPEWVNEFYFGHLDGFRMVANSVYMGDLIPPKKFWRSDPFDNQIGELETEEEHIYTDKFKYRIKIISFENL